jgi:cell division protein FtsB
LIEIKTADKNYDIYLNNVLIISFSEIAYKSGEIGFLVGPLSKGRVDFLYLFSVQKDNENNPNIPSQANSENSENDVLALAESIITLKTQINKLAEENEDLKQVINSMKNVEKETESDKKRTELTIKNLELQAKNKAEAYDSLLKVNTDLLKYKEMVSGNDNGDLIINLSKNLKAEKLKNEELTKQIKLLKEGKEIPISTPTTNSPTQEKPEERKKSDGFVLPKEN